MRDHLEQLKGLVDFYNQQTTHPSTLPLANMLDASGDAEPQLPLSALASDVMDAPAALDRDALRRALRDEASGDLLRSLMTSDALEQVRGDAEEVGGAKEGDGDESVTSASSSASHLSALAALSEDPQVREKVRYVR